MILILNVIMSAKNERELKIHSYVEILNIQDFSTNKNLSLNTITILIVVLSKVKIMLG